MQTKFDISFPGGKKVDGHFRGFTIHSDQPLEDGGSDANPSPFEYFLASIGMCAGFYVLSFCQSRALPTSNMAITQTVFRNDTTHRVEKLTIDILLPADFPEKYKDAVIRSAELCAVKKHLENPPQFDVTTKVVDLA